MVKRNVDILINAKDRASRNFKETNKSAQTLKRTLQGFAAVTGVTFGFDILRRQITGLIEAGDEIGKSSKRIGITAEEYQKLTFAARRAGAANDDVEKSFKRMSSTIFDAQEGLAESERALSALGLEVSDLQGKKPEQQFALIADRLNMISDASTKAALAQDVFGRAGTKLIPMISSYKELAEEAEKVGIISNENVQASEDLADAIENLKTSLTSLASDTGIITFLRDLSEGLSAIRDIENLPTGIGGIFREGARGFFDTGANAFKSFLEGFGVEGLASREQIQANLERLFGPSEFDQRVTTGPATKQEVDEAAARRQLEIETNLARERKRVADEEAKARAKKLADEQKMQLLAMKRFEASQQMGRATIIGLQQEIQIQKLLNAGKEKQAAVQAAVNAAQAAGVLGEDVDKIAKLRSRLFDLQSKANEQASTVRQQDPVQATVARFLSFRQDGPQVDRIASENNENNKKTATNTEDMKNILNDIATSLDTQRVVPIQAANFGA